MYKELTPIVLQAAFRPLSKDKLSQMDFVFELFYSYFLDADATYYQASRIMHGGMTHPMRAYYADPTSPGCARQLHRDVAVFAEYRCKASSRRCDIYRSLLQVLDLLPESDRRELTPAQIPSLPTQGQLTDLLTSLLWYAATQDAAMKYLAGQCKNSIT